MPHAHTCDTFVTGRPVRLLDHRTRAMLEPEFPVYSTTMWYNFSRVSKKNVADTSVAAGLHAFST